MKKNTPRTIDSYIEEAKKKLSKFTIEYSGTGEKVVAQSPDAGEKLEEGGTVRLLLE